MKKPELNDFKRDVYNGDDVAEWYQDYYEALEKYTEHLESERDIYLDFMKGLASASPAEWGIPREKFDPEFVMRAKNIANTYIEQSTPCCGARDTDSGCCPH